MREAHINITADSGSTKTAWRISSNDNPCEPIYINTQGINPVHQNEEVILSVLQEELLSQMATHHVIPQSGQSTMRIAFYGAGCFGEFCRKMESVLQRVFPQATSVIADSDLMGAAIALYGHQPGIACILGTGANSGLYDGTCIVAHTNPMGYILGDEGSGASLGKNFLNLLYKNHLPPALLHEFESSTGLTYAQVIQRVYREPLAARFLASLSPFIHDHLHVPALRAMVSDLFQSFFRLHIAPYRATLKASEPLTVGFVGSVAYYYRDLLEEAAKAEGFALGTVLRQAL